MIISFITQLGHMLRVLFKEYIHTHSDLLLNISLAGDQLLKWINHKRKAQVIYLLMADQQSVIY